MAGSVTRLVLAWEAIRGRAIRSVALLVLAWEVIRGRMIGRGAPPSCAREASASGSVVPMEGTCRVSEEAFGCKAAPS